MNSMAMAENMNFESLGLSKGLCKVLEELNFLTPTDIQRLALPPILAHQDLIGIAPTGTGKTLAYLLPIIQAARYQKGGFESGPAALVVVPSRELAKQVATVAERLCTQTDELRVACLVGGLGLLAQRKQLENGPFLVVGTPGRVSELYLEEGLSFKKIKFLVLDEADRLMDMGFSRQLRGLLEVLPRKKQILLFSATFNAKVEQASTDFLEWPIKVQASKQATVPDTIEEHFVRTPNVATKWNLLFHLSHGQHGFVFARTRDQGNQVLKYLQAKDVTAQVLHANKGQNTREKALEGFREGLFRWFVTTDVASRGLDIVGVPIVIQFGLPVDMRDYVHRTGRTGRAGLAGLCYTFLDPGDEARLPELQKVLGRKIALEEVSEELLVTQTPMAEKGEYDRIRDEIRQKVDPTYQGAFHQKQSIHMKPKASTANLSNKGNLGKKTGKPLPDSRKKKSR